MNQRINVKEVAQDEINLAPLSTQESQKHLKGYMYDSLVYRFKDYQARAFQIEVMDYKNRFNVSELDARKIVGDRHNRDLMRFIQILDEAIGEHD